MSKKKWQVQVFKSINEMPIVDKTAAGQEIRLGGFSGLAYLGRKNGKLQFLTHTDRGPNPEPEGDSRPFALPDFNPEIVRIEVDEALGNFKIVERISLLNESGAKITGIPPSKGKQEDPVDLFGKKLSHDPLGLDLESIVIDPNGGYWMGDEYGPSLVHFNKAGQETRRLVPGKDIPEEYLKRKKNRGFEGIALVGKKLYAFLQSPLKGDGLKGRILEYDLATDKYKEFEYPFESEETSKIGDAVALPNGKILVIEQDGEKGPKSQKRVYRITLNKPGKPVEKELILDLTKAGFTDEKAEGLAVLEDGRIVVINDNDFNIDGPVNFKTGKFPFKKEDSKIFIFSPPPE